MSRKKLLLVGVVILGVFSAVGLLATNFQIYEVTTGNYADAKWPGSSPNITWLLNFTSTPANVVENDGVTTSDSLVAAFNTWKGATYNGSAVSTIGFTAGTPSASLPQGPATDCQNVIGFDDTTSGDFPTGVIAFASISTVNTQGASSVTYTCGSVTPNPTCAISGGVCIVDVDIMFNPNPPVPSSTTTGGKFATSSPSSNQYDLQSIATHEIGHMIGLDHSGIAHAVMYPYGDTSQIGVHQALWTDDMVGAGHLYPGPAMTANGTGIEGKVTVDGTGVYAAHVEAIDATTGDAATDTLTDPSGNYHLLMFGGTYYLYVQSLAPDSNHGPCTIGNFGGQAGYGGNDITKIPANPTNYTGAYY